VVVVSLACLFLATLLISIGIKRAEGALFSSKKSATPKTLPKRYVKVALTGDEAKSLSIVFDASNGRDSGYDVVYAEVGPSVDLERAKKLVAKGQKRTTGVFCPFPPLEVQLPNDEKSGVTSNSCTISLCHCREGNEEKFCVTANVAMRQGATRWQYSSRGMVKPSENPEKPELLSLNRPPQLKIETRPDLQAKGNTGIGLTLAAGAGEMDCKKGAAPLDAHVVVKTPEGKIVHEDSKGIDQFAFG
jgi:hypothetical protein